MESQGLTLVGSAQLKVVVHVGVGGAVSGREGSEVELAMLATHVSTLTPDGGGEEGRGRSGCGLKVAGRLTSVGS